MQQLRSFARSQTGRTVIAVLIILSLILAGLGVNSALQASAPPPPTPTATAVPTTTPVPLPTDVPKPDTINIFGWGGPSLFGDPEIMEYIRSKPWTYSYLEGGQQVTKTVYIGAVDFGNNVSSSTMGKYQPKPEENIAFIFPGDKYYADMFTATNADAIAAKQVTVYANEPQFNSKMMVYLWWSFYSGLKNAGYIYEVQAPYKVNGETVLVPHMPYWNACRLIWADARGETYRDLGIVFDKYYFDPNADTNPGFTDPTDYKVDLNTTAYSTSTGLKITELKAGCLAHDPEDPKFPTSAQALTTADISKVAPLIAGSITNQGSQGSHSLTDIGANYVDLGPGKGFYLGQDGALMTVLRDRGWSNEKIHSFTREGKADDPMRPIHLVGVNIDGAPVAQHTIVCIKPECLALVAALNDPEVQTMAWGKGMGTDAVLETLPPVWYMSLNVPTGTNNTYQIISDLLAEIKARQTN